MINCQPYTKIDCIILAGGLGTRLRSVVSEVPKCMASVCNQPFIYYILSYLKKYKNIDKVILSLGYKHEVLTSWLTKQHFPFEILYSIEDKPLGTGGAIKKNLQLATTEEVVIMNGDTFFDVNLNQLLEQHRNAQSKLSIALKSMKEFNRYGNVAIDNNNRVISFNEKRYCKQGQINGGIYIMNKNFKLLDSLPDKFSFETEVLQLQAKEGALFGFVHNGYFIDIGIPEDYQKANIEF